MQKVIIYSGVTKYFFANHAYFSIYIKDYYKFEINFGKILKVYGYKNIVLYLVYLNSFELI